jgi:hypothetical protein
MFKRMLLFQTGIPEFKVSNIVYQLYAYTQISYKAAYKTEQWKFSLNIHYTKIVISYFQ